MSNPSDAFECRWQPSRWLLRLYLSVQALALLAPWLADIPIWSKLLSLVACLAHAAWVLPRHVLLTAPQAITGLRELGAARLGPLLDRAPPRCVRARHEPVLDLLYHHES